MNSNNILQLRIQKFKDAYLENYDLKRNSLSNNLTNESYSLDRLYKKIDELIESLDGPAEIEYVIRDLIDYLKNQEFISNSGNNMMIALSAFSKSEGYREIFDYKIELIIAYLLKVLDLRNIRVDNEVFSKEEFEDLKSKLHDLSKLIFDFQEKQDAANEVLYDSINAIYETLIFDVEKGRIFGKEFVKQYLAGKIMDMTFKGGVLTFLSNYFDDSLEISTKIKELI